MGGKECIRPAVVIPAAFTTFPSLAVAQDAAQAHPQPLVEGSKGVAVAVLEVFNLETAIAADYPA